MTLPVTNLDDRRFQDLVDEAKRRIPELCPEWTNHNLSDPGVALIELFAWMTEMTVYRLNQVPDNFYTQMLNLLGFQQFAAAAAQTDLTFWISGSQPHAVTIPLGTQVTTTGSIGDQQIFTTRESTRIEPPVLTSALTSEGDDSYVDVWDRLELGLSNIACFPRSPITPGDCFYLGFENSLAGNAIRLSIEASVEGIGVIPTRPPLIWEVWEGEGWIPASIPQLPGSDESGDTTGGLNRNGDILLLVPNAHQPLMLGGVRAHWLRARLLAPVPGQPGYRASPQVRRVSAVAVGGSVLAEHSEFVGQEYLGTSTGKPDQAFTARRVPILPRAEGEVVEVVTTKGDEEHVEQWREVEDFVDSHRNDPHYTWDSFSGEIRFGPLIRYPEIRPPLGRQEQRGAVPPAGAAVRVTGYRTGGGAAGNVGAGTLTGLRTAIPFVTGVTNLKGASGGVDAETVENAKLRGPQSLRAGGRAVTVTDFERLAREADGRIGRVRCLPPIEPGAPIRLLVVPRIEEPPETLHLDDFALPDDMIARISDFLDDRRILGTKVEVGTPYYQGVTVAALITTKPGRPAKAVRDRALSVLYDFINPLTGGPDRSGWAFDADLNSALVFQLLDSVEGVERVDEVLFFETDLRNDKRLGFGKELVKLSPHALFLSAKHQVVVR